MMKAKELRDLTGAELQVKLQETRKEFGGLRFQQATNRLEKPARIRELRREIARIETLAGEKRRLAAVPAQ